MGTQYGYKLITDQKANWQKKCADTQILTQISGHILSLIKFNCLWLYPPKINFKEIRFYIY